MNLLSFIIAVALFVYTSRVIDATSNSNGKEMKDENNENNLLVYSSDSSSGINDFQDWIPLPWIKLIADAGFRRKNAPPNDDSLAPSHPFNTVPTTEYKLNNNRDTRRQINTPFMLPPYEFKRKLESPVVKVKKINHYQNTYHANRVENISPSPAPLLLPLTPPSVSTHFPFSISSVSPPVSPSAILLPRTPPPSPQRSLPPPAPYTGDAAVVTTTPRINHQCTCSPTQKYLAPSSSPQQVLVKKQSTSDENIEYSTPISHNKVKKQNRTIKGDQDNNDYDSHDDNYDDDENDYNPVILKGLSNAQLEIKCSQLFESKRRQSTGRSSIVVKQSTPSSVNRGTFKLNSPNTQVYPRTSIPASSLSNRFSSSSFNNNSIRKAASLVRGRAMAPKSVSFSPRSTNKQSNWLPLIQMSPAIAKCR